MRFEKKSENVIRSEVSQKEKDKCCILPQTYGIQKNGIDEPICRAGTEVENRLVGKEEGRVN